MTWLTEGQRDPRPAGDRLAQLWTEPGIVGLPGAHDPLAALLARRAGFRALYLSGAALTATLALPDLGVLALGELIYFTRAVVRASGLPVVVDGDTGYGEVLNVVRLVRELEDAGAAAVQLEDQVLRRSAVTFRTSAWSALRRWPARSRRPSGPRDTFGSLPGPTRWSSRASNAPSHGPGSTARPAPT